MPGAEIDVDFVLHGSAGASAERAPARRSDGTAGPASRWAETCRPGEHVLVIDEGLCFNPSRGEEHVLRAATALAVLLLTTMAGRVFFASEPTAGSSETITICPVHSEGPPGCSTRTALRAVRQRLPAIWRPTRSRMISLVPP